MQEESDTQAAGYQKRRGFSKAKGEDFEIALCSLLFLRALRHTSDFFLASNHDIAGVFDDVVLFYRLQEDRGHEYRVILLQAKHKERITKKKLTLSNPFKLQDYLKSFKEIRHQWEHPLKVGNIEIQFKEIILVLYTNTGCVIGEAAVDVTNFPQEQHLHKFLNTGGRLLRISDGQRLELPQGQETSNFLSHLLLCTEQVNVDAANSILEEELCNFFKLTSPEVARKLNTELQRVVKDWWSEEGTVHYLTAECEEWKKVLQVQITRLNRDTINIDRQINVEFTDVDVKLSNIVPPLGLRWISVRDEYQAKAVRSRLFRAQRNSLVIAFKQLDHLEEVVALWRNDICPTLVLDVSTVSPEETSLMLQRLQQAVQIDAGRRLVVIAKGKPISAGWNEVDAELTWSILQQVTRDRLLAAPVRLQGETVALRDIVGSRVSDVMSDEVISSLCKCEMEMKLGVAMPAPLEYSLPRCLQRTISKTVNVDTLTNTNILVFSSNYLLHGNEFTKRFKIIDEYEIDEMTRVKYPTIVEGVTNDYDIRQLCVRFRAHGIYGEISTKGFIRGNITEFIPFTWTCEEKIVVIEGPPGIGKSSFVTMMCFAVKQQFSESWVLRLDMGHHTDYIKETDFTEVSHIKELLIKGLQKDLTSVEQQILENSLSDTGNVFLFLDAFDEISPYFTRKCCDLLKGIDQTIRYRQMVVTTRPVTTKDVEEALQTKAFTLPVFSEEEQGIFLKQFSAAKGKQIGEVEISSLCQFAGPALQIPLLCKMAAEVFLLHRERLLPKCQNPWRRILLYDVFVEQSVMDRVAEKLELDISRPGLKILLESHKNLHLQNLQGLAVKKLMPVDQLPPLSVSTVTPEEKLGLVVNSGVRIDFEHQTFAEYFLGCWLAHHWQDCPRQLLRDMLFQGGFDFVTSTLSWLLFNDLPLHMAVAQGDEDLIRKHLSPGTTDRGGRSVLHVAAMTKDCPRNIWELLMFSGEDLNRKDDVLSTTAVKYAEIFSNWEFVDLGLQNGADIVDLKFVTDEDAAKEILIYAVKSDLVFLSQFIWRRYSNVFQNLHLLHLAAANNSKHLVKLLIDIGYEVNALNESGLTSLEAASIQGHVEAVTLLLESGANINIQTECGFSALILASLEGQLKVVKTLLEKGADLTTTTDDGDTALTKAAREGHLEVVNALLEKGADVIIRTEDGDTALIEAAREGHLDVVNALLEKGADVTIKTEDGDTALIEPACEGHLEVVKTLLERGADFNMAITEAAREGHLELVKFLLEKGADINIKSLDGNTALTGAAHVGHLEIVKILLKKGADFKIKTKNGYTALILAALGGHLEVVKTLVENGADVTTKTQSGDTALSEAAGKGHTEVVKILLEKGADLNIKNTIGSVALIEAAGSGHLEVVKILLEKGADLNIQNWVGNTALTEAAARGHLGVVKILLEKVADLNIKNRVGNTALMEAVARGHLEVVNILLEKAADVNTKNHKGETESTLADKEHHRQVFKRDGRH